MRFALADRVAGSSQRERGIELAREPEPKTGAASAPAWSAWKVRTAASTAERRWVARAGVPSAASTSSSDILPLAGKARSDGGTSPRGAGSRSTLAYSAAAHRSSGGSRPSNAGMAVPTVPMLIRRK